MIAAVLKSPRQMKNHSHLIFLSLLLTLLIQSNFSLTCDVSCATCSGTGSTNCLTCSSGRFYLSTNHSCGTTCPNGYFRNTTGQVCTPCDSSCATCSSSTNTTCLTCASPKYFLSTNSSCGYTCPSGYFKDDPQVCTKCDSTCTTCSDSTNTSCLTCTSPKYFYDGNNSCSNTCPSGYYKNSGTQTCTQCYSSCATCNGGASTNCQSCSSPNYFLSTNKTCSPACPSGYYADNTTQTCIKCDATCGTCNGTLNTNCVTCSSPRFFLDTNNSCITSCPSNYFQDNGQVCTRCDSSCLTCSDSTNTSCTACSSSQYLITSNNSCAWSCPSGYFYDSNRTCTKCDSSCGSCNGTSSSSCFSCSNPNYFLNSNHQCVSSCGGGYYSSSQVCYKCDSSCISCSGTSTTCTSCLQGQYLVSSTKQCVFTCPSNSYLVGTSCISCDSNCATCSGSPTNCLTCPSGDALDPTNNSCYSMCPQYYEWRNGACVYEGPCDVSCATSQCLSGDAGQCITCKDPTANNTGGSCICPSGYIISSTTGLCIVEPNFDIGLDCATFDINYPNCVLKQNLIPQASKSNNSVSYTSSSWNAVMQQIGSNLTGSMAVPLTNDSTKNLTISVPASFAIEMQLNGSNLIAVSVVRSTASSDAQNASQNITSPVVTLIFVDPVNQTVLPVSGLLEGINITFPMTSPSFQQYVQYIKSNPNKFPSQNYFATLSPVFKCRFWNTTTNLWESAGVTMIDMNETTITCATVHTTEFAIEFNSSLSYDNLTDPVVTVPDTSYWHTFVTTSYTSNLGVYVVFVIGVLYFFCSSGGFFADFLSARLKKKDQLHLLPWWFASEGRQILEKLSTGDLTRVVYSLRSTETHHDMMLDLKDVEKNLQKAKESQPISPATIMPPQSEGEQSAMRPIKNKEGTGLQDFHGDLPTGLHAPHKGLSIAEIHISTPSGSVSSGTLFKEYLLALHPLINMLIVSAPFFSPRPTRALMFFGSISIQLLIATFFFQPINNAGTDIDIGTIMWQGIVVWVISAVVMYIITMISMLRKHHITEILAADPNDAATRLRNFMVPNRIRAVLLYSFGILAITGICIWVMVFGAVNGWDISIEWLGVFIVAVIFDQVIVEFGIIAVLVWLWKNPKSENRKRFIVMKYKKVMLVG